MKTYKIMSIDHIGFKMEIIKHFDNTATPFWIYRYVWSNNHWRRRLVDKYSTSRHALTRVVNEYGAFICNNCLE